MGNVGSRATLGVDMNDLSSLFSEEQLKTLLAIFSKLDEDGSGRLSPDELRKLEGVENNPLVSRVIDVLDADAGGDVDFKEFVESFAIFTSDDEERKLRFAFSIYDIDRDNYISNGELFQVLKMMVGTNLGNEQLQQIVDKTIVYSDTDGDGRISFEEFCQVVAGTDAHQKMNLKGKI